MVVIRTKQLLQSQDERDLIGDVFKLWVMARIQTRSERICGTETIGIEPQLQDPDRHDYGRVPVPPVISAQITIVVSRGTSLSQRGGGPPVTLKRQG